MGIPDFYGNSMGKKPTFLQISKIPWNSQMDFLEFVWNSMEIPFPWNPIPITFSHDNLNLNGVFFLFLATDLKT
jgi:hypothetical protein